MGPRRSGGGGAGNLTLGQLKQAALDAGWPENEASQIAAIAMAESQGNPNARGRAGEYGVTQILPGTTGAHRFASEAGGDPVRAMQLALEVRRQEGWRAWSVYKDKKYLQYMDAANAANAERAATAVTPAAPTGDSQIQDVTGRAGNLGKGPMSNVSGMIVHHTAGRGTLDSVLRTFRQTGYPAQFVIDREGHIFRTIPEGQMGHHMRRGEGVGAGRSNLNMQGVEIIANDDADVLDIQKKAALRLIDEQSKRYGYDPTTNVFGHGEVNPGHKQASEGMGVVNLVRATRAVQETRAAVRKVVARAADMNLHFINYAARFGAASHGLENWHRGGQDVVIPGDHRQIIGQADRARGRHASVVHDQSKVEVHMHGVSVSKSAEGLEQIVKRTKMAYGRNVGRVIIA